MKYKLLLILTLAFVLRFAAVNFGLPFLYHADEPIVVNHALAYGAGDLNPHFFKIPPLLSYLLFICYGFYFVVGKLLGVFHGVQDFENLYYADPSSFYLIARIFFGVIAGTATIFIFYKMIQKHFGDKLAWMAGFLFAICFLHVRDSHYVYPDIPLVFLIVLSWAAIWRVMDAPTAWKSHILSAVWVGAATAMKYNGAALFFCYLAAVCFSGKKEAFLKVWLTALISLCVFIFLNPYMILDFQMFRQEVLKQNEALGGVFWFHHLAYSLVGAGGLLMLVAALAGMVRRLIFWRESPKKVIFVLYGIFYYALISLKGQNYDRYVLPLIPVLVFFAAEFCVYISDKFLQKKWAVVLLLLIGMPSLVRCLHWDALMLRQDTRSEAKLWIENHIPSGSKIALDWDFFMPRLFFSTRQLSEKKERIDQLKGYFSNAQARRLDYYLSHPKVPSYDLFFLQKDAGNVERPFLFSTPVIPYDVKALHAHGIQYVVLVNSFDSGFDMDSAFRKSLPSEAKLLHTISPFWDVRQIESKDTLPLTGGPFLWRDIMSRRANGYRIAIYEL